MSDFKSAWQKAQKSGNIYDKTLYASHIYTPQRRTSSSQLTFSQKAHSQAIYHPTRNATVWPELKGFSQHRTSGYSAIEMERISKHAANVFSRAEYFLSAHKERW